MVILPRFAYVGLVGPGVGGRLEGGCGWSSGGCCEKLLGRGKIALLFMSTAEGLS